MGLLIIAIRNFAGILTLLLLARAICSWFVLPHGGGTGYRIYRVLSVLTEPIVAPCRKITERFPTGMFDFSVILALLLVRILRDALIWLIGFVF